MAAVTSPSPPYGLSRNPLPLRLAQLGWEGGGINKTLPQNKSGLQLVGEWQKIQNWLKIQNSELAIGSKFRIQNWPSAQKLMKNAMLQYGIYHDLLSKSRKSCFFAMFAPHSEMLSFRLILQLSIPPLLMPLSGRLFGNELQKISIVCHTALALPSPPPITTLH